MASNKRLEIADSVRGIAIRIEELRAECDEYFASRSERWKDSDDGVEFESAASSLQSLESDLGGWAEAIQGGPSDG